MENNSTNKKSYETDDCWRSLISTLEMASAFDTNGVSNISKIAETNDCIVVSQFNSI